MKVVDLSTQYQVEDGRDVSLTIKIGDAQIGSSVVKLGNKERGRGDINGLELGDGKKIRNNKLKIKSLVTDVNDRTNKTSITYLLSGGSIDQEFVSQATVDKDGDAVVYRALFTLV